MRHENYNSLSEKPWIYCEIAATRLKFIHSEKATKFCKIFTLLLTVCTMVKIKLKISHNLVAFSEHMNFKSKIRAAKEDIHQNSFFSKNVHLITIYQKTCISRFFGPYSKTCTVEVRAAWGRVSRGLTVFLFFPVWGKKLRKIFGIWK